MKKQPRPFSREETAKFNLLAAKEWRLISVEAESLKSNAKDPFIIERLNRSIKFAKENLSRCYLLYVDEIEKIRLSAAARNKVQESLRALCHMAGTDAKPAEMAEAVIRAIDDVIDALKKADTEHEKRVLGKAAAELDSIAKEYIGQISKEKN